MEKPRDYDVVIPFFRWDDAVQILLAHNPKPNSFGGYKVLMSDRGELHEIDVWPGDIGRYFCRKFCKYAWHPASNTLVTLQTHP